VAYGLLMIYLGDAGSSLADGDAPDDALAWMALRRRVTAGVPAAVVALTALLGWASRRRPVVFLLSVTSPVLLVALSFITNSLWTAANPPP
jgi:hypothetical protein